MKKLSHFCEKIHTGKILKNMPILEKVCTDSKGFGLKVLNG